MKDILNKLIEHKSLDKEFAREIYHPRKVILRQECLKLVILKKLFLNLVNIMTLKSFQLQKVNI